jgi:hypothetical protein
MAVPRFLRPDTKRHFRPDPADPKQHDAVMYVRSILLMRIGVGLAALLLPIALYLVDRYWFHGSPHPRDSMSAYYWSGVRDIFVTVIFGIGAFLVGYKIAEINLDNTASILAGLGALCLAWFPAKPGCDKVPITAANCAHVPLPVLTPLQQHWTPSTVWWFHLLGTAAFVGGLAVVSYLFGVREGKWDEENGKRSPTFWRRFHKTMAWIMVGGIVWILVSSIPHHRFGPSWDILIGEVTCVYAFGFSWLLKGWEWDTLTGRPIEARRADSTKEGNPPPPASE